MEQFYPLAKSCPSLFTWLLFDNLTEDVKLASFFGNVPKFNAVIYCGSVPTFPKDIVQSLLLPEGILVAPVWAGDDCTVQKLTRFVKSCDGTGGDVDDYDLQGTYFQVVK